MLVDVRAGASQKQIWGHHRLTVRSGLVVLIVREGLANTARHSGPRNAEVVLKQSGGGGILSVRDNRIGMDITNLNAIASIGLRGIKERAVVLGSDLALDSRSNEMTQIMVAFHSFVSRIFPSLTNHPHGLLQFGAKLIF